jgi:hypothetical protein
MRVDKSHFERLRLGLVASVMALAAGSALAAEGASATASGSASPAFVPTLADYLSIYDALFNYRLGVEKHDEKAEKAAFWEDARRGGGGGGGGGRDGGPPPGANAAGPGGPPPGAAGPPPGAGAPGAAGAPRRGPPNWEELKKMPGYVEVWHLPLDSYIHFDSPTRATHYEYFLSIYPQPEKKAPEGGRISNMEARTSIIGWPGHYEDILEKRNGEWRILQRKMGMNEK